jgi:hypothetical protein
MAKDKKLSVKDLKALAFDKMQEIKQREQEYNAIIRQIVELNYERGTDTKKGN